MVKEHNANLVRDLFYDRKANVTVTFALALIPIVTGLGAAVDYSRANSVKTAMQAAADAASLGSVKLADRIPASELQQTSLSLFTGSFLRPDARNLVVNSQYDSAVKTVTVDASANVATAFMGLAGIATINVKVTSKASTAGKTWPVCVLVTHPNENHTLLAKNNSRIDFENCMVQVNTLNWDAVESRDTSYIHSTNGENCFVGEIHYGDVRPPKNPTCTFLPDPFDTYTAPSSACKYTNFVVNTSGTVLEPGTYCGGIVVNKSATFKKGLYVIRDGKFQITGSGTDVTALGTTFVLVGQNGYIQFDNAGSIKMSPADESTAGVFAGFQFYYDDPDVSSTGSKKGNKKGLKSTISKASMNAAGIFYFQGQQLIFDGGAKVIIDPGTIIADFILPDGGSSILLRGSMNSSSVAEAAMRKSSDSSGAPVLVK